MDSNPYIHTNQIHNTQSAAEVLPYVLDLLEPCSVLDIGCGIGTWLDVAKKLGIREICGLDTPFANTGQMHISLDEFVAVDLTKPFDLQKKFDLAICLEVAEHLPESVADTFIHSITQHSDVVLFSAAIPGQGGQNHINEQWPDYWANLFYSSGFLAYDIMRTKFWNNQNVYWWYSQNMIIYAKKNHVKFKEIGAETNVNSLIHPMLFSNVIGRNQSLENSLATAKTLHYFKKQIKRIYE